MLRASELTIISTNFHLSQIITELCYIYITKLFKTRNLISC